MKKVKMITACCLMLLVMACSNDDDGNESQSSAAIVTTTMQEGSWRVTYFFETDVDQTDSFLGYDFIFNASGTVDASNDLLSQSGTWEVIDDNSSSQDDDDFLLVFPTGSIGSFEALSEDWEVLSSSATTLELTHLSGGNGSVDVLTFTKN